LGSSLWVWETPFGFGKLPLGLGNSLWVWEAPFGFGKLPLGLGNSLWVWEAPFGFGKLPLGLRSSFLPVYFPKRVISAFNLLFIPFILSDYPHKSYC
jgi:hypothetical protein